MDQKRNAENAPRNQLALFAKWQDGYAGIKKTPLAQDIMIPRWFVIHSKPHKEEFLAEQMGITQDINLQPPDLRTGGKPMGKNNQAIFFRVHICSHGLGECLHFFHTVSPRGS
jgi:hypothetical protein